VLSFISSVELSEIIGSGDADADSGAGTEDEVLILHVHYRPCAPSAAYLPGAVLVKLDEIDVYEHDADTGHPVRRTGNYSLQEPATLRAALEAVGATRRTHCIVYENMDDKESSHTADPIASARVCWCLAYCGVERVSLLDGGLRAWRQAGLPVLAQAAARRPALFDAAVATSLATGSRSSSGSGSGSGSGSSSGSGGGCGSGGDGEGTEVEEHTAATATSAAVAERGARDCFCFPMNPHFLARTDEVERLGQHATGSGSSGISLSTSTTTTTTSSNSSSNRLGSSSLFDVRSHKEFTGCGHDYPFPLPNGRIPHAQWLEWGVSTYCGGLLADATSGIIKTNSEETVQILRQGQDEAKVQAQAQAQAQADAEAGVERERRLVFYCASGWRSALAWCLARAAGFDNSANYDGGFMEWSYLSPEGHAVAVGGGAED